MIVSAACVDVTGSSRALDVAYVSEDKVLLQPLANVDQLFDWIKVHEPKVLAIDAPCKTNQNCVVTDPARHGIETGKYENFRVCEALLRMNGIGLYNTPREKPPEWIKTGWKIFDSIKGLGYSLWETPGKVSLKPGTKYVLEVHPHACFVVGLGWIPQTKSSLAGQFERIAYLKHEAQLLDLDMNATPIDRKVLDELNAALSDWDKIRSEGLDFPEISHDELDSIAGLFTAINAIRGEAFATGYEVDGVIVTPSELADSTYCTKHRT